MVKTPSKPSKKTRTAKASVKKLPKLHSKKVANKGKKANTKADKTDKKFFKILQKIKQPFIHLRDKWRKMRGKKVQLHRSFRRSYREDYLRETKAPGLLSHAMATFQMVFRHWKTFVPFILIMTASYIILVGLMSENLYQQFQDSIDETSVELANGKVSGLGRAGLLLVSTITTGGLDTGMGEAQVVFMLFLFLVMWLVTIYLLRHFMAGGKPKLRDGLYNALSPLISTLLVFVVIFIQAVPLMLVVITYSAAISTGFLATPFYALVYFIFAAIMVLITMYLLSSSLIALVAVTAPGMYPLRALFSASDLMAGRRTKFIIRVLFLLIVAVLVYIITMTPIILIDLGLKNLWDWLAGVPIVPFFLLIVTCFVFVYATAYLYRYYRHLIDYQEK